MLPANVQRVISRIQTIQKRFNKFLNISNSQNQNQSNTNQRTDFRTHLNNAVNNNQNNTQNSNNANAVNNNSLSQRAQISINNNAHLSYPYKNIINEAAQKYGLSPALIRSIIKVESNFKPKAVSSKGAKGLMQIMPVHYNRLGITDPFNPYQNIMSGTRLLKEFFVRFDNDINKALAAYNAGPNNVINNRVPNTTKKYINKVLNYFQRYGG